MVKVEFLKKIGVVVMCGVALMMTACGMKGDSMTDTVTEQNATTELMTETATEATTETATEATTEEIDLRGSKDNPYQFGEIVHFNALTNLNTDAEIELTPLRVENNSVVVDIRILEMDSDKELQLFGGCFFAEIVSEGFVEIDNPILLNKPDGGMFDDLQMYSGGYATGYYTLNKEAYGNNVPKYLVIYFFEVDGTNTWSTASEFNEIWFELPQE